MTKLACVFPGQGSQSVGMLSELAQQHSVILDTFSQASSVLGYNLWDVVQNDPDKQLNLTYVTQPALLTASVAIWRTLQANKPVSPAYLAGHSLGEYSALVCAEVLDFENAVKLVEMRGKFMQEAVPEGEGAMYAIIGLDDKDIIGICDEVEQETQEVVSAVNFNSPGQVVIAGSTAAAAKAAERCKEAGAKRAMPLSVSAPSHCALMRPAADRLADELAALSFNSPKIPVINNVDVTSLSSGDDLKDALVRQLYCPVRWTETVRMLAANGVTDLLEIGPGKVLSGLTKRIDKSLSARAVNTPQGLE